MARSLFNRRGFADVSIDEIMANAGLTRGGFYNHFATKEELYAEVVRYALTCAAQERLPHVDPAAPPDTIARELVCAYLSNDHLQDRERSCSLVTLASDVGRGGSAVRRAYQHVVESMVVVFARGMSADDAQARGRALAITSLCVGSMVMSRAIDDESLTRDLLQAAEEAALSLGGWDGDRSRVAAE